MPSTSEGSNTPSAAEAKPKPAAVLEAAPVSPEAEAAKPAAPETPAKRGGGFSVLALGFVAGIIGGLLGGGAIGVLPIKKSRGEISALDSTRAGDLDALKARVGDLDKRLAAASASGADAADLRARLQTAERQIETLTASVAVLSAPPGQGADPASRALSSGLAAALAELRGRVDTLAVDAQAAKNLSARIAALETRVPADLGAQLAALAAKGDVSALDQRLSKLEANTSAADAKRAAATIALANLVRTAQSGAPFTAELEAVRYLNVDPALVGPLAAYAGQGVRPVAQLAESFGRIETAALRASGRNWWERLWAGLFVVKPAESKAGTSVEAVLSRAKAAARTGNLQDAVGELGYLTGPPSDAVAAWRAQAQARLTLDSLLTKLSARVLADVRG